MNLKFAASCLVSGALLLPIAGYAAESDSAKTMVNDSAITTKVKAELAEEKVSSLVKISVVTDNKGVVTLGRALPQARRQWTKLLRSHAASKASPRSRITFKSPPTSNPPDQ